MFFLDFFLFASVVIVGIFSSSCFQPLGVWFFACFFFPASMALVMLGSDVFWCLFDLRCIAPVGFLPSFGVDSWVAFSSMCPRSV